MPDLKNTIAKSPKVQSVAEDDDGFWAELKIGWRCIYSGAHTCREESWEDLARSVRDAEPCECTDCVEVPEI